MWSQVHCHVRVWKSQLLSLSSLLAQSESNRPHPPTIHSFTPRLEIYERIVATPLIIALAFAFVYSKKAARVFLRSCAYWFMGRSRITCKTYSSFSTRRGREIPRLHPRNYRTTRAIQQAHILASLDARINFNANRVVLLIDRVVSALARYALVNHCHS